MRRLLPRILCVGSLGWASAVLLAGQRGAAATWEPVPPAELAAEQPRVDPQAGVEILHREVVINDNRLDGSAYRHHLRLKVFNARGVSALSKIDILDTREHPVRNVAARVVHPDGRSVEVAPEAIYSREVLRRGALRVRVKSFSFPGLQPGCIAEYRWEENNADRVAGLQLHFQSEFPTWHVRFRIKPFDYGRYGLELRTLGYLFPMDHVAPDRDGYYGFEMQDVAARRREPLMPPDDETQPWIMFYFVPLRKTPDEFWRDFARDVAVARRGALQPTREIALRARSLTAGLADDTARIAALYAFCQDDIRNLDRVAGAGLPGPEGALPENRTAADVLARGYGTGEDINALFLALASAVGLEARPARVSDRSERFFNAAITSSFMLPDTVAAVRVAGGWRFYDPGRPYLPAGSLAWQNEGVPALVCDRRAPEFVNTPVTAAAASRVGRLATLAVDAEGTVTGTVRLEYSGHSAVARKTRFEPESPERREAMVRAWARARWPGAEVGPPRFEHADDAQPRLAITFALRIPGYAERAGRRLFIPLAFFARGEPPRFHAAEREFDIYFPFQHVEEDTVDLLLPEGFAGEDTSAPMSVQSGAAIDCQVRLTRLPDERRFEFSRILSIGGMYYPRKYYGVFKEAFDEIRRQDGHRLVARTIDAFAPWDALPLP